MNKTYQPNFTNKAFLKRAARALAFVETYVSTTKSQWLSSRYIDKHFGQYQNPLSKYLRELLLICVDDTYSYEFDNKKCKSYIASPRGIQYLKSVCNNISTDTILCIPFSNEQKTQLETGKFDYKDSSSRLYNPIQNIRRDIKKQLLAQYSYEHTYDIVCSCPTLILEYIKQLGSEEYPNAIKTYINNRTAIRQRIAQQCEISEQQVKRIINGLFQGAHISNYTDSLVYKELGGDPARIAWLKQDEFLIELRADIKMCWRVINQTQPIRTRTDKNGRVRRVPLSGRRKTAIYRDLERRVLDAVRLYLLDTNEKFFLEHDGWSCASKIDREKLTEFVREQTGFDIEIDYEFVCKQ